MNAPITPAEIEQRIKEAIPDANVRLQDLGGGDHWGAVVVSSAFAGKSLIEQHRMVKEPLKEWIRSERIHAFTLKTLTPDQAKA